MMYQPKNVGKTGDFKMLTLCISLNSSQVCTNFCKALVTKYSLYPVKNSIPNRHLFTN